MYSTAVPAACEKDLSVHLDGGASAELAWGEVGVVRRVDVVVGQRLVHVLVDVQTVQKHWRIVVWHQVTAEAVQAQPVYNQAHNQSTNIYTTSLQSGTQPVYNQAHKGIYQY